jgi:hypothetical protein
MEINMKKFVILTLAALSLAGSLYAGSCGGCSSKKDKDASTEKTEDCSKK